MKWNVRVGVVAFAILVAVGCVGVAQAAPCRKEGNAIICSASKPTIVPTIVRTSIVPTELPLAVRTTQPLQAQPTPRAATECILGITTVPSGTTRTYTSTTSNTKSKAIAWTEYCRAGQWVVVQ